MNILENIISADPPGELYHYTSQEGLLGILENRELWASKAIYMNDEAEFRLALSLAREAIEASSGDKDIKDELVDDIDVIEKINIFVCSFSARADLLSQWRGYCPPGAGYSIGFPSSELEKVAERLFAFCLGKCTYDPIRQRGAIEELVDFHVRQIKHRQAMTVGLIPSSHFIWAMSFRQALAFIAPLIKHEAFEEEAEWRLVSRPLPYTNSMFSHRPGRSHLIPFANLPLSISDRPVQIKKIIVGPTPHPDLACDAVKSLLGKLGVTGCGVEKSKVPFRAW